MKECKRCHISFATSESVCPLCQNALVGTCDDLVFPTNIRFRTNRFLVQLFLFISLVVLFITGFIELMLSARLYYSLFILAGLATNFILVTYVLLNKQDILDLFGKYGLILVLLSLLWYVITKNTIITNYIIPSFCIFELLFNLISFIVLKNHYIVGYLKILLLNLFLLIIPGILILLNCITVPILTWIAFVLGLIILLGLLMFYFDEIQLECKKIFNI